MPEQPAGFDPREAERLDRAIDRIVAGAAPDWTGDPQLDRLVALAARLHHELPRDLPDPAFRARLKDDLTGRIPLVQPVSRRPIASRYLPVYGSLAAVFLVALVVGALAFWPEDDEPGRRSANTTLMQATIATTVTAFSPPVETVPADVETQAAEPTTSSTTALRVPSATTAPAPTSAPSPTDVPAPSPTAPPNATESPAPGSATVLQARLPGIDPATVEEGPVPAAGGGGEGPSTDVTYVMDVTAPSLATSSTVYRLTPPAADPVEFCRDLAAKAGIPDDDVRATDESGRTEVFAGEPGAGVVYWRPDAGVFQVSSVQDGGAEALDPDAIAARALGWLESIGYPVASLGSPRVDDFGDLFQVDIPLDGLPTPGVGHPLGVTLMVHRDGTLAEAHGYWLAVDGADPVSLVSVEDAWSEVTSGGGYWRDGGMSSGGGEFRAENARLSSVLTRAGSDLVLQPVIEFSGTFTTKDGGSSAPVSVFVKATGD